MNRTIRTAAAYAAAAGLLAGATSSVAGDHSYNTRPASAASKRAQPVATGVSGFAVVRAIDGKIARGANAVSATHDDTGSWIVAFNSNIRKCAYTGNVGLPGDRLVSDPGYLTVVGASADANAVYVQTFNASGALTDLSFQLVVTC